MAEDTLSTVFYWETIVIKVEDKIFCVPQYEFVQSSEVFADMFLLPSGPVENREGRDREHPIFLEGYKKDEFVCLLKVMYPTAGSFISGTKLDLSLEKDEWVSVLKLSTIWNMDKIRKYAIHRLSTEVSLSPTEKILLARAHKVPTWLEEGVASLVSDDSKPTLEEFATLGWETATRILWIKDNSRPSLLDASNNTLRFHRDAIKCGYCSSSSSIITGGRNCSSCGLDVPANAELTFPGLGSASGTTDRLVELKRIQCKCTGRAFDHTSFKCSACSRTSDRHASVRITPKSVGKDLIMDMFGEEIKDYELRMTVA